MSTSRTKTVLSWVVASLLAAGFIMAGLGKLTGAANEMFAHWGYAAWFATFIGVIELAGAVGLLIPRLTRPAILGLAVIMIGAAYTHVANGEGLGVLRPIIFMVFLATLWWLRQGRRPQEEGIS